MKKKKLKKKLNNMKLKISYLNDDIEDLREANNRKIRTKGMVRDASMSATRLLITVSIVIMTVVYFYETFIS